MNKSEQKLRQSNLENMSLPWFWFH